MIAAVQQIRNFSPYLLNNPGSINRLFLQKNWTRAFNPCEKPGFFCRSASRTLKSRCTLKKLKQIMTLSELLPAIEMLPASDKLKLIRILAEQLDTAEGIAPLEPLKTYELPTPYNLFGAGAVLMQAMQASTES